MIYQGKDQIGVDLMRFKKEVPNSTMDFLFIQLLIYCKANGYRYFSFGVARWHRSDRRRGPTGGTDRSFYLSAWTAALQL
jgi:lysylphosphatidylglycerol synthetase-like protein (DUF2156 family)